MKKIPPNGHTITIYKWHNKAANYLDDDLFYYGENDYANEVVRALGYKVLVDSIPTGFKYKELEWERNGNWIPPESLAKLVVALTEISILIREREVAHAKDSLASSELELQKLRAARELAYKSVEWNEKRDVKVN